MVNKILLRSINLLLLVHSASSFSQTSPSSSINGDNNNIIEGKQLNIAFVTGNKMKAREMDLILSSATSYCRDTDNCEDSDGDSLVKLRLLNVDLPEIQESNTEAIAKNKAIQGSQLAGGPCVVEDTSLKFVALGGMPGPFIKWFQDKVSKYN